VKPESQISADLIEATEAGLREILGYVQLHVIKNWWCSHESSNTYFFSSQLEKLFFGIDCYHAFTNQ